MSETEIAAKEEQLHAQFAKLADAVTAVQSVWVYAKDGRALVTSTVHPPPQEQRYADRDYFVAQLDANAGIYYGGVYPSRFNGEAFFGVSKRLTRDGAFWACWRRRCCQYLLPVLRHHGLRRWAAIRAAACRGTFLARYPQAEGALLPLGRAPALPADRAESGRRLLYLDLAGRQHRAPLRGAADRQPCRST